jgi:hypothetical protein
MALMDLLPNKKEKVEEPAQPVAPPSHCGILEIGGMYPTAWDTSQPGTVSEARAKFDAAISAGYVAQVYRPGVVGMGGTALDGEVTRTFDPEADVVRMSLPYAGG